MIGAVLLGNTFINILASSLTTALLEDHLGKHAVAVTTAFMTAVILIFVEVLPKTLAIARTDRVALALATPLQLVVTLLAPILGAVQWLVWRLLWVFGVRAENREYEWDLPEDDATTIAGLVIQQTGTIPEPGQRFAFFGFTFEILRRQRNQITALKVTPPAAKTDST